MAYVCFAWLSVWKAFVFSTLSLSKKTLQEWNCCLYHVVSIIGGPWDYYMHMVHEPFYASELLKGFLKQESVFWNWGRLSHFSLFFMWFESSCGFVVRCYMSMQYDSDASWSILWRSIHFPLRHSVMNHRYLVLGAHNIQLLVIFNLTWCPLPMDFCSVPFLECILNWRNISSLLLYVPLR